MIRNLESWRRRGEDRVLESQGHSRVAEGCVISWLIRSYASYTDFS